MPSGRGEVHATFPVPLLERVALVVPRVGCLNDSSLFARLVARLVVS